MDEHPSQEIVTRYPASTHGWASISIHIHSVLSIIHHEVLNIDYISSLKWDIKIVIRYSASTPGWEPISISIFIHYIDYRFKGENSLST